MYYYKATVRLNGNTMNEVVKRMSAPELLVLQYVHGTDAIVNVEEIGQQKTRSIEEKQRLKGLYEQALVKREQSIDRIFGALGTLPDRLPEELLERFQIWDDDVDEDDILAVARKNSKNKSDNINQPKNQIEADRKANVLPAEDVNVADLLE